ncbi:MAG: response regulator [Deltaproteobacteria bacterium]|nr:response regulator [Deltaproteobacteria bacterium]
MKAGRQRILIVDDREANIMSLTRVLSKLPVEVVPAVSGDAALRATLHGTFALAILDVQMPGMDGFELADHLRGDDRTRHLPIIFLTAYQSDESQALRGIEAGAVDYIVKPFNPALLLGKVQVFLELDRARHELVRHRDTLEALVRRRTAELEERNRTLSEEILRRESVERDLRLLTEELEQRVRERTAEAEAANRAKSAFLANMSHEIRTPLNAILGYAQLLAREAGLTCRQGSLLEIIDRSGEHLLSLLNDVLEMSRIEADRVELSPSVFDFHRTLVDLEMMFRNRTDDKGLRLVVRPESDVPKALKADEGRARQVLINLLGNAVKFTQSGLIEVRASVVERLEDSIRLVVEVCDSGCGVPESDRERIFHVFEQTGQGRARGGAGLGLPISRRFARMMGGDVTVRDRPGGGSIFRFEFRAEACSADVLEARCEECRVKGLAPGQAECRALVVDDHETGRDLLSTLLSAAGFVVRTAVDGVEALDVLGQWSPHVCLTDKLMPRMDGIELARRIKSLPRNQAIPVIMVSGSVSRDEEADIARSGVPVFLSKPLRVERMFKEIGRLLRVEFVYEDESSPFPARGSVGPAEPLDSSRLRILPEAVRTRLAAAVGGRNLRELLEAVDEVEALDPTLHNSLREAAEALAWDRLAGLLRDAD